MDIDKDLQAVKRIFVDYPKLYGEKSEELKVINSEIKDLLHVLELANLNAVEMSKIMKQLKKARLKRRHCKNELEVLDEIKRFGFKRVKESEINTVINRVHHITNRKRIYTMRVREDLQNLVEG